MGPTDGANTYCGWNLDDVEIWALVPESGTCEDGIQNQGEDRIDCGGPCPPCDCVSDGVCDDELFCTGVETCDDYGHCQAGAYPCGAGAWCDEGDDACIPHGNGDFDSDGDVDLGDFADFQVCFGESAGLGCEPGNMTGTDAVIDLDDFAAVRRGAERPAVSSGKVWMLIWAILRRIA